MLLEDLIHDMDSLSGILEYRFRRDITHGIGSSYGWYHEDLRALWDVDMGVDVMCLCVDLETIFSPV